MFLSMLKFLLVVGLPFGVIAGLFGYWFEDQLEKRYPYIPLSKRSAIGTALMFGLVTVLMIGFFVIMHLVT